MKLSKPAHTDYPIMSELQERYSPRAYDPEATLDSETWGSLWEAARWAPSASNTEPWRFVVALRGTKLFDEIHQRLSSGNQDWAQRASALVVNAVEHETVEGKPQRWSEYDLGQAVAHFSIQAAHLGVAVHQMGGFDKAALTELLGLEPRFSPHVVMAVGRFGDVQALPEPVRERERAERSRKPLAEIVQGVF